MQPEERSSPSESPHRARSKELRKGRWSQIDQIYSVTTATYNRKPLFADWRCGRLVVHGLRRESGARTLAFVVMPDHLHWLFQLKTGANLSRVLQSVKSVSAHRINRFLGERGPVWQDGFHDRAIRRDEDVVEIARYIVANPLRAHLVEAIGDYPLWDAVWPQENNRSKMRNPAT